MIKTGFGYDIHALVENRRLILGGVDIPFHLGLKGHSDADVLCHAVADALLGAAALGDIGEYFPDTDPIYKDTSSILLLKRVFKIVTENGWEIVHVDSTVVAQEPKLLPHRDAMRLNIGMALHTAIENVSVKATTNEGFGAEGRVEAIKAFAVATLKKAE